MITRFPKQDLPQSRNGKDVALYTPWPERQGHNASFAQGIHTVFSASGSLYQRWQADLLAYSHRKANQAGPLTRLLSSYEVPTPFFGRTFVTEPHSPHPLSGDDYTPYNKPKALGAWLREATPAEDAVLILDPDCIFLKPLEETVSRGRAIAHPMGYLDPTHEHNVEFVKKHCSNPKLAQAVGIPILIHRDDLAAVTPLWLEKTEEIRNDQQSREHAGWVAEMWAYAFAAAELGIEHVARELARFSTEDRADLPLIHYCYASTAAERQWSWDKWSYKPWAAVPEPPDQVPSASKAVIGLLNEWVKRPEQQVCLQ